VQVIWFGYGSDWEDNIKIAVKVTAS